jgi:hypothetical protein
MRLRATRLFSIGSGRRLGVMPILDQIGVSAAAAYSLRKLRADASLACRVRRSSNNAEANIGFATAVQTRTNLAAIPINNDTGQSVGGVAITTIGTGTEFGQPYVDVRWQGTAVGGAFLTLGHGPRGAFNPDLQAPVTPGLSYTASVGYRLLAGTPPTTTFVQVDALFFSATGAFIVAASSTVPAATATLQRGAASGVAPTGAAYVQPIWRVFATNGTVVDFTMRFYAANVEQGIGNARPLLQRNVPEVVASIGDLDAEALLAFVGNGDGFVTTWYDQSGNGRHAAQTTAGTQPRIVSNGAIVTENGRPAPRFDGNDLLITPSFILGDTVVTVARRSSRFEPVVEGANVAATDRGLWGLRSGTTDFTTHLNYGINSSPLNATNADGFPMNVLQIVSQTTAKGTVATNAAIWAIGHGGGGYVPLNGFISEMVATSSLLSTTDRQAIERNQGEYYGISFLALDQLSAPAAAAYSLRKLRAAYTGSAIRVRRSSDNAELDIGFTANSDLDTAALLAHVGSGDGFVTTWYDQSGNGRNAVQATANLQPRIVSNGVIQTQNGRATVVQTATNQSLLISGAFTGMTSATGVFVFRQLDNSFGVGAGAHGFRMSGGNTTANNHSPAGGTNALDGFFSANRMQFNNYGPSTTLTTHSASQTGTALQLFKNGTQIDGDKTVAFTTYATEKAFLMDSNPNGTVALSEGIVFGTAISTADRQLIERGQGAYYGTIIL